MKTVAGTLLEAALILAAGTGLGLAVNSIAPTGLELGRDHFPRAPVTTPESPPTPTASAVQPDTIDIDSAVLDRLRKKGLVPAGFDEVAGLWKDPLHELGAYVFIDARGQDAFEQGHIPGARPYDPYRPDRHLTRLLPLLPGAARVVVYCSGGDCEDSESAALQLQGFGAAPEALRIYAGGMTEWRERAMPVETGADTGDA